MAIANIHRSESVLVQNRQEAEKNFLGKSVVTSLLAIGAVVASVLAAPVVAIIALVAAAVFGLGLAVQSAKNALDANDALLAHHKRAQSLA